MSSVAGWFALPCGLCPARPGAGRQYEATTRWTCVIERSLRLPATAGAADGGGTVMTLTTSTTLDLDLVKSRQQQTWASGDFAVVASRIVLVSELLADSADLHAGWRVLDVACGNGNATLAAARSGTTAVGIDYVPDLIEAARARAVTEGLDAEFHVADAEALPFDDATYDAVLSVFGSMFAPDHRRTATEMVRVT